MRKIIVTLTVICLLTIGFGSSAVHAQFPRYRSPAGSPLPSALNYFRGDFGLLDPYNAFVAPQQRLKDDLRTLNDRQQILQQEQTANSTLRNVGIAPTGTGSMFNYRSHYFPLSNQPIRKR